MYGNITPFLRHLDDLHVDPMFVHVCPLVNLGHALPVGPEDGAHLGDRLEGQLGTRGVEEGLPPLF